MMPEDTGFGGDIYEEALHFKLQNVSGTIVVYDSTDEESFHDVASWINEAERHGTKKIILVGNKCDLKEKQVVDVSSAQEMAQAMGILFIETSAKDGINVKELFEMLVREIDKEPSKLTGTITIESDRDNQNHHSKCCI
eukprot:Em0019g792a